MLCLYPESGLKLRLRVCSMFAWWIRGPDRYIGRATGRDEESSHGRVRNVAAMVAVEDIQRHPGGDWQVEIQVEVAMRRALVERAGVRLCEAVVWLRTIERLVPLHSLRSPSALVVDYLVGVVRLIGISPSSAGHDAACLSTDKILGKASCLPSQPARPVSRLWGPLRTTQACQVACRQFKRSARGTWGHTRP